MAIYFHLWQEGKYLIVSMFLCFSLRRYFHLLDWLQPNSFHMHLPGPHYQGKRSLSPVLPIKKFHYFILKIGLIAMINETCNIFNKYWQSKHIAQKLL